MDSWNVSDISYYANTLLFSNNNQYQLAMTITLILFGKKICTQNFTFKLQKNFPF